jgi:hypothetical protein
VRGRQAGRQLGVQVWTRSEVIAGGTDSVEHSFTFLSDFLHCSLASICLLQSELNRSCLLLE